jgi:hypothetical protein
MKISWHSPFYRSFKIGAPEDNKLNLVVLTNSKRNSLNNNIFDILNKIELPVHFGIK